MPVGAAPQNRAGDHLKNQGQQGVTFFYMICQMRNYEYQNTV
jgi:hypothetical protein